MTTQQVADRLVELCRMGKIFETQEELYADEIVSIEPDMAPVKEVKGKQALYEKGKMFEAMVEEHHSVSISDPIVAGSCFAINWIMDTTMKGRGRMQMEEICVYQVKDGKIILEQFFY